MPDTTPAMSSMSAPDSNLLSDWIEWLEQLNPDRIELGLERVRQVWQQLDCHIASTIVTVAGTNGKGSVVAMLEQVQLASGRSVMAYTSPHLLRFNERIRIDGVAVADAALVQAFQQVAAAQAESGQRLTYFEFTTLAALWLIARQHADVSVLEVGLGGRLDAVNIIDTDAAVLTSIGMDHMQWLGDSRQAIAGEKVAIARPGKLLVCGDADPPAVIGEHARAIGARLLQIGVDFDLIETAAAAAPGGNNALQGRFHASWLQQPFSVPLPVMAGAHQRHNMACVLALLTAPDSPLAPSPPAQVPSPQLLHALSTTRVPGRQQRLRERPELIVDVAHNEQAVAVLVDNLQRHPVCGRTLIVLAMLADKDFPAVLRCLQPLADQWLLPQIDSRRALPPQSLQQWLLTSGVAAASIHDYPNVTDAVGTALNVAQPDDRIVVLGSFVTAAALLADWDEQFGTRQ